MDQETPDPIKEEIEKNPPFHDEGEIDLDLASKIKLTGHNWKQRGNTIFCDSCPLRHSSFIGMEWILVGIDESGMPRFAKRGW